MELSMLPDRVGDAHRAADGAAALESAGLDAVRVAEAWGFDSPTITGCLAARTERLKLGAAILVGPEPARPIETVKNWL
ncbi:LLM class flavin-dependent oxidoreductase [Streptomyces subrutilus]|uniref:Luciferase-like domain-containing protein n=1 Tax=Streptomyces subrutilus TaxID=36818 RepID=A0A1E5PY94_9ACTN|nr:LLM class flavin-dependent oxidoreductase [Streptomyces subrutilus]OEJ34507.1 hypothetical protein BGK67_27055 [Streptomyces subrutilus]